jgi:hypothetical protein
MPAGASGWKDLWKYLGGVVLLATVCSFVGYAAAVSYAALFKIEGVEPLKIAGHTFHITGSLGLIGALLILTFEG